MTKIYKTFPREKLSQFINIYPESLSLHICAYVYMYVHRTKNISILQNMDGSQSLCAKKACIKEHAYTEF